MNFKKIILIILLICWMTIIFIFSSQSGERSGNTSRGTVAVFLDEISITDNMSDMQKQQLIEGLQKPIRKLAHVSMYALGGIISFSLINQYSLKLNKKLLIAFGICVVYAITDEIHQAFVPERSSEIMDVLIDSIGVMLGIFICNIKNIAHRRGA